MPEKPGYNAFWHFLLVLIFKKKQTFLNCCLLQVLHVDVALMVKEIFLEKLLQF